MGVTMTFAGQAGFLFETETGLRVGVDLYLSDCCHRYFGFKRLLPYLFDPHTLNLDVLVATHAHYDHFDPDSVPTILENAKTQMVAAYDVKTEAQKLGLPPRRFTYLSVGETFACDGLRITAMPCDHGKENPHAIGLLIEINGKTIYIAGDTAYRESYFRNPAVQHPDVFIMPINGAFGNLNEREGALAASLVGATLTVPCHYWNFAEHGGNPQLFMEEMKNHCPDRPYVLMRPAESLTI